MMLKRIINTLLVLVVGMTMTYGQNFGGFGNGTVTEEPKETTINDVSKNWKVSIEPKNPKVGETAKVIIKFDPIDTWYIYGSNFDKDCGPQLTTIKINKLEGASKKGVLQSPKAKMGYSDIFECDYSKYTHDAYFVQEIVIEKEGQISFEGKLAFQMCSDKYHTCLNFDKALKASAKAEKGNSKKEVTVITPKEPEAGDKGNKDDEPENVSSSTQCCDTLQALLNEINAKIGAGSEANSSAGVEDCVIPRRAGFDDIEVNTIKEVEQKQTFGDIIWLGLLAFIGGLLTLITPCVFPLIPMTVSFFTKSSESKGSGVGKAIIYGVSIIVIYVIFGLITSLTLGENAASVIAVHWLPNTIFFLIFILFAFSFLGAYDLTLPSKWVNGADKQADKGGLVGIFFMALTLVLVSFSCTGPIASSFLIGFANGNLLMPVFGMFCYAFGMALPFVIFAFFPSVMKKLPQSGGWLNSVKVVFGLLEFAFAFKFLSQVDLAQGWGLLDRDVFLAIWIGTFGTMFLYLIGKIKFPHDSELKHIGVFRGVFAVLVLSFTMYLVPGMWGAPLKPLAGILPPLQTQDFDLNKIGQASGYDEMEICETPLYESDKLHLPHGLKGFFDVRQALCCAKAQGKPIFVDYTGHTCGNCREVEAKVWSDPKVLKLLNENFVILSLYGDDNNVKILEPYKNKKGEDVTTLGEQTTDFMTRFFKENGKPSYTIIGINEAKSSESKVVLDEMVKERMHYTSNIPDYVKFLEEGMKEFKVRNK